MQWDPKMRTQWVCSGSCTIPVEKVSIAMESSMACATLERTNALCASPSSHCKDKQNVCALTEKQPFAPEVRRRRRIPEAWAGVPEPKLGVPEDETPVPKSTFVGNLP